MATLEELLAKLDLGKYAEKFKAEEIDLAAARALSEDELKELGLPLGPRKKLHGALHESAPAAAATASATSTPAAAASSSPAKPAAPATAGQQQPKITNFVWRWQRNSQPWPEQPGAGMDRFRLEDVAEPERLITSSRAHSNVSIFDIPSGCKTVVFQPFTNDRIFDGDFLDDTLVTIGGDSTAIVGIYNISGNKLVAKYIGPSEGGLHDGALVRNASGALVVAAARWDGGEVRLFDVNTGARASKITGVHDANPNAMYRDPTNQSFVWVSDGSGKIFGVDLRVSKKVRTLQLDGVKTWRIAPGKVICASWNGPAIVVDLGTGKTLHKIASPKQYRSANTVALYANVAVTCTEGLYSFYNLDGAGAEITEPVYDLVGQDSEELSITRSLVISLAAKFVSMENVQV